VSQVAWNHVEPVPKIIPVYLTPCLVQAYDNSNAYAYTNARESYQRCHPSIRDNKESIVAKKALLGNMQASPPPRRLRTTLLVAQHPEHVIQVVIYR
jgi:hypothetical protein